MANGVYLEQLMKELVGDGRLIEAGWVALRITLDLIDTPTDQLQLLRRAYFSGAQQALMNAEDRIDELVGVLERIQIWSEAYPVDIFPEPDMRRARELLKAGGITLDVVAASISRNIIAGVGDIVREVLAKTKNERRGAVNRELELWAAAERFIRQMRGGSGA